MKLLTPKKAPSPLENKYKFIKALEECINVQEIFNTTQIGDYSSQPIPWVFEMNKCTLDISKRPSWEIVLNYDINDKDDKFSYSEKRASLDATSEKSFIESIYNSLLEKKDSLPVTGYPQKSLSKKPIKMEEKTGMANMPGIIGSILSKNDSEGQSSDIEKYMLNVSKYVEGFDELVLSKKCIQDFKNLELFIIHKKELEEQGGNLPKGIILKWVPGVWKTAIIKAIAKENTDKMKIFKLNREDYTSKWVWQWEQQLKSILEGIKQYCDREKKQWVIVFDEFETIAQKRWWGSHEAHDAELNILLRFLDWVEKVSNVTFIWSTNVDTDKLDPAILRWWRCDMLITLELPHLEEIKKYLELRRNKINETAKKDLFDFKELDVNDDYDTLNTLRWLSFWDIKSVLEQVCNERFLKQMTDTKWPTIQVTINDILEKSRAYIESKKK